MMSNPATKRRIVKLETCDKSVFVVEEDVAKVSLVLRNLLENLDDQSDDNESIPLAVSREVLEKIIEWAEYHKYDPPSLEDPDEQPRATDLTFWDLQFMNKINRGTLVQLIMAADYLDIKPLLDLTLKFLANIIISKSIPELSEDFGI